MFQTAYACSESYVKDIKHFEQALIKSTAYNCFIESYFKTAYYRF